MIKRFKRLVSVICMIAVVVCLFSGSAFAASIGSGGPKPPLPPIDLPLPSFIQFDSVKLTSNSIPQGGSATVYGFVIYARSSVNIKVSLQKYYNSYNAYTINTYTMVKSPTSGIVSFVVPLNLQSQSAGHYQVVVEATEYGRTISKTLPLYIT
ncbi:MAG: hypothetical protein IJK65_09620 [Clostridiales bacterium]|nr:hypothetical protein [Clostridiales bacterium]